MKFKPGDVVKHIHSGNQYLVMEVKGTILTMKGYYRVTGSEDKNYRKATPLEIVLHGVSIGGYGANEQRIYQLPEGFR